MNMQQVLNCKANDISLFFNGKYEVKIIGILSNNVVKYKMKKTGLVASCEIDFLYPKQIFKDK